MKVSILSIVAVLLSTGMALAQGHAVDLEELPPAIQEFINMHFEGVEVKSAETEKGLMDYDVAETYEVTLSNGIKLDFNKSGEVTEIESKENAGIPKSVVPEEIYAYVAENYEAQITSWEIDHGHQEVELSNDVDLEFDLEGSFLSED